MDQTVIDNQITRANEISHKRHIRGMSAHEHQCSFGMLPVCDLALQLLIQTLLPGQKPASGSRRTILADCIDCRIRNFLASGHACIIIRSEIQYSFPVHQTCVCQW